MFLQRMVVKDRMGKITIETSMNCSFFLGENFAILDETTSAALDKVENAR